MTKLVVMESTSLGMAATEMRNLSLGLPSTLPWELVASSLSSSRAKPAECLRHEQTPKQNCLGKLEVVKLPGIVTKWESHVRFRKGASCHEDWSPSSRLERAECLGHEQMRDSYSFFQSGWNCGRMF